MTRSFLAALTLVLASTLLAGCGFFGDRLDPKKNWTVEEFYKNAREELDSGNYGGAVKAYEALEAKYPFGRYAQQSQLDIAYAYYKDGETAQAVSAADRFLKLHPNHVAADYALYIKGLAYFKPDLGLFGELLNLDPAERDPKALRESFEVFKELVTRFPDSKYTDDSLSRMSFLVNALAKHDVAVARYYLSRGAYLAAANRAQNVFQRYPQAPANEDALVISIQAYEQMGLPELANSSRRVLEKNFPKNNMISKASSSSQAWWKLW
ncbi:MAG: outer membrane protein assembly factor BamD [Betaproteobacteria bacterium]